MSRAYLKLDPNLPDHKGAYPDGAIAAFVFVLCLAAQQPRRGYFRSEKLLRVLLERRARWIRFLLERRDLIAQDDGSLYVDGWKEWQEGDLTVPERMARLRARRAKLAVSPDTPGTVSPDTAPDTVGDVTQRQRRTENDGTKTENGAPSRAPSRVNGPAPLPETLREPDDPNDAELVADLRRWATSKDQQIARHNRERLERMGLPLEAP